MHVRHYADAAVGRIMTWLLFFAALWFVVSCGVALAIGRGLRIAERTEGLQRAGGPAPTYDREVIPPRRLAG